jgi:aromatic ring-opening dioxygenase catalytic subunit (LigB family)
MAISKLPTYFISHGGGPWPWLKQEMPFYAQLEASLQDIPRQIGALPKAVLMISGHWESDDFAVMSNPKPGMLYDYSGFPEHTYHVQYPAPGDPALAQQVHTLLTAAGLPSHLDAQRGFDHGMFAPMFAIYPQAEVPVIQLSLQRSYDPAMHVAAGRALAVLREQGVLIIGSGLSYHNLRAMFSRDKSAEIAAQQFDTWLQETLLRSNPAERYRRLVDWEAAPAARAAHPSEDHLIPLMVALGAAESEPATLIYHENFNDRFAVPSFRFG